MHIFKRYDSAFVVEKSKLTRLLSVIKNVFHQNGISYRESFIAHLTGEKTVSTDSLQHILELDNSERSKVQSLIIQCGADPNASDDPRHLVEVHFYGHGPVVGISIDVTSEHQRLASEVMSVAEEQVERTLERGLMYRILRGPDLFFPARGRDLFFPAILISGMGLAFGVLIASVAMVDPEISKTMWLTPSDLAEIQPMVQDNKAFAPEQATGIFTRQLRNVIAQESASPFSVLSDWRVILIFLPAVIVTRSFVALLFCYPPAVFLWGDAEEWYRRLLVRRAWIWNMLVLTLVVGIIGNLAVFAFGSLIDGRSM